MTSANTRTRFDWSYTEEPHATRRRLIMKKYPEIKQLFGYDPAFKWVVAFMVFTQIIVAYMLRDSDWALILLQAYLFGGTVNHALTLAIHEVAHNVGFGNNRPLANRILGIFINLPIGLPMSVSFKKYHIEHHRYMGEDGLDTDIPTELEGQLFTNSWRKALWLLLQPFFYCFRPLIVYKKAPTDLEYLNVVVQIAFNAFVYQYFGFKSLFYLIFASIISLGWHPTAGHFISEHYIFQPGQETSSYYGALNHVVFNVGYHVEHHDFPFISGDKLPYVQMIAPEYYSSLAYHTSWVKVMYDFVMNPSVGPYSRIKRKPRTTQKFYGQNMLTEYFTALLQYVGFYSARDWLSSMNQYSCIVQKNQ